MKKFATPRKPLRKPGAAVAGEVLTAAFDPAAIETLQRRLIDAEQSMEREQLRVRQAEARYRLLIQIISDAVLIVDADTGKLIEANAVAVRLLGNAARHLVGHAFPQGFDPAGERAIEGLLACVRSTGRGDEVRATLSITGQDFLIAAALFRQDNASLFLVRLAPVSAATARLAQTEGKSKLLEVLESSPDGLVVTSPEGHILTANRAFLDMAQLAAFEQVRSRPLDRWLGRPGVDLRVLIGGLRQHGAVRLYATTLRGECGSAMNVELSAVSVTNAERSCLGFTIRNVDRPSSVDTRGAPELARSAQELAGSIGRVSLKALVRESTDVIERLCIEAALEITGDNRATAAEMLGLSRQSLYAKLRRYSLGDLGEEA